MGTLTTSIQDLEIRIFKDEKTAVNINCKNAVIEFQDDFTSKSIVCEISQNIKPDYELNTSFSLNYKEALFIIDFLKNCIEQNKLI